MRNVLTCAQMRAADKYTMQEVGIGAQELMERAGKAIAEETASLLERTGGRSVLAVCGGGNNGGDGWCAARILAQEGYETAVYTLTDKCSQDCAAQRALYAGKVYSNFPKEHYDVIVDAIFGTGFHGVPEGIYADAIERINASGSLVVSADIPSGLNGDTGTYYACVKASRTVTLGELKGGLLLGNGADVCGELICKDIGIRLPERAQAGMSEAEDFRKLFLPRKKNTNKGNFGKAVIVAGSLDYSGAALLSASAALRGGCGYTQLILPQELFLHCIGKYPEVILTGAPSQDGGLRFDEAFYREKMRGADSIAVGMGCGVSESVYEILQFLLSEYRGTLLIDADGINSIAQYGADVLREKGCRVILTPHPKEFARLCQKELSEVLTNGAVLAKEFAAEYGVAVLLKGHTSVITNGNFTIFNTEGTPALAKGGSGDVLSGLIASLAARGASAMGAASCGAFLLGRAGCLAEKRLGEYSVTPSDVIGELANAILSLKD